jgi:hypothetical protein
MCLTGGMAHETHGRLTPVSLRHPESENRAQTLVNTGRKDLVRILLNSHEGNKTYRLGCARTGEGYTLSQEEKHDMDEEYMTPYRALAAALLTQAIKDANHKNSQVRQAAQKWLWHDTFCVELCEWLGYSHTALREALEGETASGTQRKRSLKTL